MAFGNTMGPSGGGGFNQWYQSTVSDMAKKDKYRRDQIQRYYDDILRMESAIESGGSAGDLFLARNILKEYEKLSGKPYEGSLRRYLGLAPYESPMKISITSQKMQPSEKTIARRAEKAAIKTKREGERQELADAQWLSQYDARRAELEKRATSSGVSAQDNYDAQQDLIRLDLERQRRETRMPGYETPSQVAKRKETETLTAKRTGEMERQEKIDQANNQFDRLVMALDPVKNSEAIARINKLRPQLDKGATPESILRQAQAIADSELAKEKRTLEERRRLQKERLDNMRTMQQEGMNFRREIESFLAAERTGARSAKQQQALESKILDVDGQIAMREQMIAEAKQDDVKLEPNLPAQIASTEREVAGLKALRKSLDDMLQSNYGASNTRFNTQYGENNPATISTQEEFDSLPSGSYFVNPADGEIYIKN